MKFQDFEFRIWSWGFGNDPGLLPTVFELTSKGSLARDFALRDQINRSAGSIMDNIAEGSSEAEGTSLSMIVAQPETRNSKLQTRNSKF